MDGGGGVVTRATGMLGGVDRAKACGGGVGPTAGDTNVSRGGVPSELGGGVVAPIAPGDRVTTVFRG